MRRLLLASATALFASLLLAPPAWAGWVWPLRGEVITPYRNGSDPYASGQHRGIDIAGPAGATVVAAAGGEVRFSGIAGSSGLTVSVRTGDGRYDTSYLHLSSTAVREGDRVAAGERIGSVGTTGARSAAAPHLHFGVRDAGSRHAYHDPLGFLPPSTPPQPPREAPAPQPSPVPVGPAPAPVPAPSPRRVPAGAPRRVPLPAPSPRRVPAGAPRRVPLPAPSPRRVPAGAPRRVPAGGPRRVPLPAPSARRVPAGAPRRVPLPGPRRVPAGAPRQDPVGAPRGVPAATPVPAAVGARGAPGVAAGPSAGQPGRSPMVASSDGASQRNPSDAAPPRNGLPGDGRSHPGPATSSGPDVGLLLACLGLLAAAGLLGLTRDGQKATRATRHGIGRVLQPILGRR
jgi:Peptidase family M23